MGEVERTLAEAAQDNYDTLQMAKAEIASLKARRARVCSCIRTRQLDDGGGTYSEFSPDCLSCHGTGVVMEEGS